MNTSKSNAKLDQASRLFVESGALNRLEAKYTALLSRIISEKEKCKYKISQQSSSHSLAAELVLLYLKKNNLQLTEYSINNEVVFDFGKLEAVRRLSLPKSSNPLSEFYQIMKKHRPNKYHDINLARAIISRVPSMLDHSTKKHLKQIIVRAGESPDIFSQSMSTSQVDELSNEYNLSSDKSSDRFSDKFPIENEIQIESRNGKNHQKGISSGNSSSTSPIYSEKNQNQHDTSYSSRKIKRRSETASDYSKQASDNENKANRRRSHSTSKNASNLSDEIKPEIPNSNDKNVCSSSSRRSNSSRRRKSSLSFHASSNDKRKNDENLINTLSHDENSPSLDNIVERKIKGHNRRSRSSSRRSSQQNLSRKEGNSDISDTSKLSSYSGSKRSSSSHSSHSNHSHGKESRNNEPHSPNSTSSSLKVKIEDKIFGLSSSSKNKKSHSSRDLKNSSLKNKEKVDDSTSISSFHLILEPLGIKESDKTNSEKYSTDSSSINGIDRQANIDSNLIIQGKKVEEQKKTLMPNENKNTNEYSYESENTINNSSTQNKKSKRELKAKVNNNNFVSDDTTQYTYTYQEPSDIQTKRDKTSEYTYVYESSEYTYIYEENSNSKKSESEYTYTYDEPTSDQVARLQKADALNRAIKTRDQMMLESSDSSQLDSSDKEAPNQLEVIPQTQEKLPVPVPRRNVPRKRNEKLVNKQSKKGKKAVMSTRKENVLRKINMLEAKLDELQSTSEISSDYSSSSSSTTNKENPKILKLQQKLSNVIGKRIDQSKDINSDSYTYTYAESEDDLIPRKEPQKNIADDKQKQSKTKQNIIPTQNIAPTQNKSNKKMPKKVTMKIQPHVMKRDAKVEDDEEKKPRLVLACPNDGILNIDTNPNFHLIENENEEDNIEIQYEQKLDLKISPSIQSESIQTQKHEKETVNRNEHDSDEYYQKKQNRKSYKYRKNVTTSESSYSESDDLPRNVERRAKSPEPKEIKRVVKKRHYKIPDNFIISKPHKILQQKKTEVVSQPENLNEIANFESQNKLHEDTNRNTKQQESMKKNKLKKVYKKIKVPKKRPNSSPQKSPSKQTQELPIEEFQNNTSTDELDESTISSMNPVEAAKYTKRFIKSENESNQRKAKKDTSCLDNSDKKTSPLNSIESTSSLQTIPNEESIKFSPLSQTYTSPIERSPINEGFKDNINYKVKVGLVKAINIPDVDTFCVLFLEGNHPAYKTQTIEHGYDHYFNSSYIFDVGANKPSKLIILVKKEDLIKGDKLLGQIKINLLSIPLNETVNKNFTLFTESGLQTGSKINLVLQRELVKEHILNVNIIQAKGLGVCTSFCIAKIITNDENNKTLEQTSTISNSSNPNYNQKLSFIVQDYYDTNILNFELAVVYSSNNEQNTMTTLTIPINELPMNENIEKWFKMEPLGKILLNLRLTDSNAKNEKMEIYSSDTSSYAPDSPQPIPSPETPNKDKYNNLLKSLSIKSPIAPAIQYDDDEKLSEKSDYSYSDLDFENGISPGCFSIPVINKPEDKLSLPLSEILKQTTTRGIVIEEEEEYDEDNFVDVNNIPFEIISESEEAITKKLDMKFGSQRNDPDVDFNKGDSITFNLNKLVQNRNGQNIVLERGASLSSLNSDTGNCSILVNKSKISKMKEPELPSCVIGDLGLMLAKKKKNSSMSSSNSSSSLYRSNSAALSVETLPQSGTFTTSSLNIDKEDVINLLKNENPKNSFTSLNTTTSTSDYSIKSMNEIKTGNKNACSPPTSEASLTMTNNIQKCLKFEEVSNNFKSTDEADSSLSLKVNLNPKSNTYLNKDLKKTHEIQTQKIDGNIKNEGSFNMLEADSSNSYSDHKQPSSKHDYSPNINSCQSSNSPDVTEKISFNESSGSYTSNTPENKSKKKSSPKSSDSSLSCNNTSSNTELSSNPIDFINQISNYIHNDDDSNDLSWLISEDHHTT